MESWRSIDAHSAKHASANIAKNNGNDLPGNLSTLRRRSARCESCHKPRLKNASHLRVSVLRFRNKDAPSQYERGIHCRITRHVLTQHLEQSPFESREHIDSRLALQWTRAQNSKMRQVLHKIRGSCLDVINRKLTQASSQLISPTTTAFQLDASTSSQPFLIPHAASVIGVRKQCDTMKLRREP